MANEVTVPMLRKVQLGDALTDYELKTTIAFYTDLSKKLDMISLAEGGYNFAAQHARHELERLKLFARNRKDRRLNS